MPAASPWKSRASIGIVSTWIRGALTIRLRHRRARRRRRSATLLIARSAPTPRRRTFRTPSEVVSAVISRIRSGMSSWSITSAAIAAMSRRPMSAWMSSRATSASMSMRSVRRSMSIRSTRGLMSTVSAIRWMSTWSRTSAVTSSCSMTASAARPMPRRRASEAAGSLRSRCSSQDCCQCWRSSRTSGRSAAVPAAEAAGATTVRSNAVSIAPAARNPSIRNPAAAPVTSVALSVAGVGSSEPRTTEEVADAPRVTRPIRMSIACSMPEPAVLGVLGSSSGASSFATDGSPADRSWIGIGVGSCIGTSWTPGAPTVHLPDVGGSS